MEPQCTVIDPLISISGLTNKSNLANQDIHNLGVVDKYWSAYARLQITVCSIISTDYSVFNNIYSQVDTKYANCWVGLGSDQALCNSLQPSQECNINVIIDHIVNNTCFYHTSAEI